MRLAWAFFKRDASIALSYRVSFVVQFIGKLAVLALFFFLSKTVGDKPLPMLARYGGDFLAFMLIGISLSDCVLVSLTSFARQIREAQTTGTLEATLMSPVHLPAILLYSVLWDYFMTAVGFLFYLVGGALLFGVKFHQFHFVPALLLFILTITSFMGVGILWAGIVLLIKRGDAVQTVAGFAMVIVSGVFFPPDMFPSWMQKISRLIPLTDALEGMRLALLRGYDFYQLSDIILRLTAFAAVLMVVGLLGFNWAVRIAKNVGSLTQY